MKRRYFKDLKFQIAFFHHPSGISLDEINNFFINPESGESAVISARGARLVANPDQFPHNLDPLEKFFDDVYKEIKFSQDGFINELSPEVLSAVMQWVNGYSTDRIIILATDDGELHEQINSEITPINHKKGGVEIIVEYLLSNFANTDLIELPAKYDRLDGAPITQEEINQIHWQGADQLDTKTYKFSGWHFDFSKKENFLHLESAFDFWDVDCTRFIHNINQEAVKKLNEWVFIPFELQEILTSDQKIKWRDEIVPKIILEHLDFIGIDLFGMNLNNASSDSADAYNRASAASWDDEIGALVRKDQDEY